MSQALDRSNEGHAGTRAGDGSLTDRVFDWLDDRVGIRALNATYGRKAFPVHTTFFLGEMALFSFVILVVTGVYLGLIYAPSNVEVSLNGKSLPEAYASVQLIESIPVANLFRNVHRWAAQVMVASTLLHLIRIFFTGTYRKPRELNWLIGVVLLGLTLMAGFVGYALPYDAFAVTATGIGYSIARSIPWVGRLAAELFFGGAFPTLGSLPRLYTIHVVVLPALITATVGLHLTIIVKQKHTQPGYARRIAEPGRVLGVPMWPYQALLAGQLLLLMFGGLFLLSAIAPSHPLAAFGPPGPSTPDVKPDWYLLWVYGFLKLVPSFFALDLPGARIEPDFFGGVLFPGLVFGLVALTPWLDRTSSIPGRRYEYLEPPRQGALRMAIGGAVLAYLLLLCLAAYAENFNLDVILFWFISLTVVPAVGAGIYAWARLGSADRPHFDPSVPYPPVVSDELDPAAAAERLATPMPLEVRPMESPRPARFADWLADRLAERRDRTTMDVAAAVDVLDGDVEDWLAGRAEPDTVTCARLHAVLGGPTPPPVARGPRPEQTDRG